MVQAYFDNIRSHDDLGLFLSSVSISVPEARRNIVTVPGRNGSLDLSYTLSGDMKFKNRTLTLQFALADYQKNWMRGFSEIYGRIHGRKFRIIIDNDPYYYWEGFCSVSKSEDSGNKGEIQVTCDVYPYKRRDVSISVASTAAGIRVACPCGREPVCPEVTTTGNITITPDGGTAVHYDAGTHKYRDLMLTEGTNMLTITGSADVTLIYTEGEL